MKVKAYRVICEEIEIPDNELQKEDDTNLNPFYSPYVLKDEYIDKYIDDDKYQYLEDMNGKTIAEL